MQFIHGVSHCRAVFREEAMANVLLDGIKMYALDLTHVKYYPFTEEEYNVSWM